jgi:hypothetical protein
VRVPAAGEPVRTELRAPAAPGEAAAPVAFDVRVACDDVRANVVCDLRPVVRFCGEE